MFEYGYDNPLWNGQYIDNPSLKSNEGGPMYMQLHLVNMALDLYIYCLPIWLPSAHACISRPRCPRSACQESLTAPPCPIPWGMTFPPSELPTLTLIHCIHIIQPIPVMGSSVGFQGWLYLAPHCFMGRAGDRNETIHGWHYGNIHVFSISSRP